MRLFGLIVALFIFIAAPSELAANIDDCEKINEDASEFRDLVRAVKRITKELEDLSKSSSSSSYSISIHVDEDDFDCDRIRNLVLNLTETTEDWQDQIDRSHDRSTYSALRNAKRSLREAGRDLNRMARKAKSKMTKSDDDRRHRRSDRSFKFDSDFWEGESVREIGDDFYRRLNSFRFNRVEGFVLGAGVPPTTFYRNRSARVYGQVGYATALKDLRFNLGIESNLADNRSRRGGLGLKVGAAYYQNTQTNDAWKVGRIENSLAAALFEQDHFDYFDVEGWTAYLGKALPRGGSVYVGYRSDDYQSLNINTTWSMFDHAVYRLNPLIDDGRIQSIVAKIESDAPRQYGIPRRLGSYGFVEAEFANGMGGDFSFNRYTAEGVVESPLGQMIGLRLRGRVGYSTSDTPYQKLFSVGGLGSTRGYYQNGLHGSKMLLGNAELRLADVDVVFMDAYLMAFADAGWVGEDLSAVTEIDDFQTSLGLGIADEFEGFRLEIAWPMNERYSVDRKPELWIRFNPTF